MIEDCRSLCNCPYQMSQTDQSLVDIPIGCWMPQRTPLMMIAGLTAMV
jgi:hypothetical protein